MADFIKTEEGHFDLDCVFLDPNNPRLGWEGIEAPGYEDCKNLFDKELQNKTKAKMLMQEHYVHELAETIVAKGFHSLDRIWCWRHPDDGTKCVAVEGNRRVASLKFIKDVLRLKTVEKLKQAQAKNIKGKIIEFTADLDRIDAVIESTKELGVLFIDVGSAQELEQALTILLSVRHINGAKTWSPYASDSWIYDRYKKIFEIKNPGEQLKFDNELIKSLSEEASITQNQGKKKLRAMSWFENFKVSTSANLPEDSQGNKCKFKATDYFLFQEAEKSLIIREGVLGLDANDLALSDEATNALFTWTFSKPRNDNDQDDDGPNNPNIFYAHRNIGQLAKMKKSDNINGTVFSASYDIENPEQAVKFREAYDVDYLRAVDSMGRGNVLESLIKKLGDIPTHEWLQEGQIIRGQITQLHKNVNKIVAMLEATEGTDNG